LEEAALPLVHFFDFYILLKGRFGSEAEIQTAKHRLRPLRRHLSVRRAEINVSEIRKLISRWHRDEVGAERNAARRKKSVSTDSRHYPQERPVEDSRIPDSEPPGWIAISIEFCVSQRRSTAGLPAG
jgi:hypothetical protein